MGEAGGGLPGNSPRHPQLASAAETSPPAFAAPDLQSLSRALFVFCFWRDPHGLSHPFQRAKLLRFFEIAFQVYFEEYAYTLDLVVIAQLITRHFHGLC